tara:strand:- start:176 stop:385 length:210 start_codon:yes stop_codon:yes gene_type:complete
LAAAAMVEVAAVEAATVAEAAVEAATVAEAVAAAMVEIAETIEEQKEKTLMATVKIATVDVVDGNITKI